MTVWVKICGNTSLEDARLAVEAGADAVGFVLAESPRRVNAAQISAICAELPATFEKIGVFVNAGFDAICEVVRACGLTGVQLQFDAPPGLPKILHEELGTSLKVLQVVHFNGSAAERILEAARNPHVFGVLVDSRTATLVGGTGIAFDWDAARNTVFGDARGLRLIAAGGLTAENVAEAITKLRPWGVDVVSGVEANPGRKDAEKVRAFVKNARAASDENNGEMPHPDFDV